MADLPASSLRLATPVSDLPTVGPRRAAAFHRLDIRTVSDLLRHWPLRHEWHFAEGAIGSLPPKGAIGSARATLVACRLIPGPRGRIRFEATLQDHADRLNLVWFNAGYLRHKFHPGMVLRVQGKVDYFGGYAQMVNPKWEVISEDAQVPRTAADRYHPVYPATEGLASPLIAELIATVLPQVLEQISDPLPPELLHAHNMPLLGEAFRLMHQPQHEDDVAAARRRLAYNELLLLQLGIVRKRHFNRTALRAPALHWSAKVDQMIRGQFPFTLTGAQQRVIQEITQDLQKREPMNRLLQGDVGAGKTVVALHALLLAVLDRKQGALMTPTELLAEQHYASITQMLRQANVRVELLTSSRFTAGERQTLEEHIARGEVDILIGTQALLTESVRFKDLALVVIDEQHRFGVLQRAAFRSAREEEPSPPSPRPLPPPERKADFTAPSPRPLPGGEGEEKNRSRTPPESPDVTAGSEARTGGTPVPLEAGPRASPHYLVMTATPIPRTLSLTVFGDLDISTIDELPPGRSPIITKVVDAGKADQVYAYLAQRVARGEQAYVVVPTIDSKGEESARQLKDLKSHVKLLADKFFRGYEVAAVHGQLKSETRAKVMKQFRAGEIQVLVATTVIEVGVDVPNATLMVVEHAERFGLAQLHQLRGRIGRGDHGKKSLCVLIAEPTTEDAQHRMKAIASTTDGFKIAEADLEIRGMGDFFGTRQHGLPPLRVARIPTDLPLLQLAKRDAERMLATDPDLSQPQHQKLRKILLQYYGAALGLIDVG